MAKLSHQGLWKAFGSLERPTNDRLLVSVVGLVLALAVGCSSGADEQLPAERPSVDAPGPYEVGHQRFTLTRGARAVEVDLWYPTAEAAEVVPIESLLSEASREPYRALLDAAPASCPTRSLTVALDAAPAGGPWPLVVYSHCVSCIPLGGASVAARLASHGIAVAAPSHAGELPFASDPEPLDTDQLAVRVADLSAVLDALLSSAAEVPSALHGRFDAQRVGALGHSFGSVSVGLFTQTDPRVKAVFGLAAPMENPLLPGVKVAELGAPAGLLIAQEDNSITELGNRFMRENFEALTAGGVEIEVRDAGHWSISDLCGLVPAFEPGCGAGVRHSAGRQGEDFDYLPVSTGISITQRYTTAFFRGHLYGEAAALADLADASPAEQVSVRTR
ncbi:MAG: hypothetical protein KF915_17010 [Polyangiaceae bacterium]|nr:hypothetical protein [Polyangiaceae bacterium]